MSITQRNKGKRGEREVAALIHAELGFEVRRRVRQDDGDSDLVGVPGWSVEAKNHKTATRALLRTWWAQTASQAAREGLRPVLIYKRGPGWWRAVWPDYPGVWRVSVIPYSQIEDTVEGEIATWANKVRELLP